DPIAMKNAARKLAAFDVDVILAYGAGATQAAMEETSQIPIIFAAVYEETFSASQLKNTSGVCSKLPISSLVRYLNTALNTKQLAVIYSVHEKDTIAQLKEIKRVS
ncbi:MAG: hypothetical protein GWN14_13115, partial [candidate division Zixibacteria bacterium]|nr:hypothetical protein [Gammaproteobacteria bacterium]NIX56827.1 hypothetical protein [candidate division Zixibacteria bacterium]